MCSEPTVLTRSEMVAGLRQLGLGSGDIVEVHSSLSSFGWVEGGADTVVDALMRVVGKEGTLVMAAYTVSRLMPLTEEEKARGILAKVQLFGEGYDGPSGMGAIADTFRERPGTVLGTGLHRLCAWGCDAELHCRGFEHLLEADGWALMLGVGLGYCSSMHQADTAALPEEVTESFRLPDDIRRDYPEDIYVSYGSTPEDPMEKVHQSARGRGLIRTLTIGNAECMLFRAKPVVAVYEELRRTDPLGLFGIRRT